MTDLPVGFVLDKPTGLPPGFVLDSGGPSVDQGLSQAFGQGATFGYGDELTAAVRAAAPGFSNWMMRSPQSAFGTTPDAQGFVKPTSPPSQTASDKPTFGERYDDELKKERTKAKAFKNENPVLSAGANIVGNVAGAAATLPLIPEALASAGPSLTVNALKGATLGGIYGGVTGFGEGEDGTRGSNALVGAGLGAGVGAAAPIAVAGVQRLGETAGGQWIAQNVLAPAARFVRDRVSPAVKNTADAVLGAGANPVPFGAPARSLSAAAPDGTPGVQGGLSRFIETVEDPTQAGALNRIVTAMQREGMTREQIEARMRELGPQAVLADANKQFSDEARRAYTLPGKTRTTANVLNEREKGRPDRVVSAFEGGENPPRTHDLIGDGKGFDQNIRAVGSRAYGDMDEAGLKQSKELMALYENPYVSAAIDRVMNVEKQARVGRPDAPPASPVEIMHKVKQAIWDMGFNKDTARPGESASFFRDLGVDFMNKLKASNPALAAADRQYAQANSLPEYFEQGYGLLNTGRTEKGVRSSSPALQDSLNKADVQQATAARVGATNAVRDEVTGRGALRRSVSLTRDIEDGRELVDRLVQLYGKERAAEILRVARAENVFDETTRNVARGTQTTNKLMDAMDTGNAGIRVTPGEIQPRFFQHLREIPNMLMRPNEPVRDAIGAILLNQNPGINADMIARAAALLEARQRGNALRIGLPAAVAGQVTR